MDLLGLVGEDAGALGNLLEFAVGVVVVEALGDASPVQVPVEVAPVAAQVGEAVAGYRIERREDREVLAPRGVDSDEGRLALAQVAERLAQALALDPAPVAKLDRHRLELLEDRVELREPVSARREAGRQLQEEAPELVALGERGGGPAQAAGQFAFELGVADEVSALV